ncbi:ECF RNA polymerase sigma-E factor [bacterium BMS3Abin04]|nr:ECF RNA polymerase sigma-E factor [bacterium BMS3Abin04]
MVGDKIICEDIIQNVFLKLFENLNGLKNKNSVGYWLFKTSRNEVFAFFRNKKVRVDQHNHESIENVNAKVALNVESDLELKEMKEIILSELNLLPVEQKDVYLLKEYGGLSYKEIASVLEIEEELVKSRLYKTRQKLIKRISKIIL